MAYVFMAMAVAIGVGIYISVCIAALIYVTTPLALVALGAGALTGVGLSLYGAIQVFAGLSMRAPILTPAGVASGQLAGKVRQAQVRRDRAWPQYYAQQARLDLTAILCSLYRIVARVCARTVKPFLRPGRRKLLLGWPLLLVGVAGLVGFVGGAALGAALVTIAAGSLAAVAWLIGLALVAVLRATDRMWQKVFRASGSCPRCYHLTTLPAYRCPGTHSTQERREGDDLHRDIRPGRLGVLWRRCSCGQRLPTTVLRAARVLQACCPHCSEPLHQGAAVSTDIRIPVFGASSAGKTQLIMAALVSMLGPGPGQHGGSGTDSDRVTLADEHSQRRYNEYLRLVQEDRAAPKTDAAQQPIAVTLDIRDGRRSALVHLFDAAGEALVDPRVSATYAYLDYARTLLFVLDPFSIPAVRDLSSDAFTDLFLEANPAQHDPEDSYQSTVMRLRGYGVHTARQRLAFAVTKRDLLEQLPVGVDLGTDSDAVRDWLVARELDNLVSAANRDFAEVRFFLVSSKDLSGAGAVAPVNWLLSMYGVGVDPSTTGIAGEAPQRRNGSADPAADPQPEPSRGAP
ncbi:TRAFAC clade GTPase domain-containing protein [Micromonospora sp. NBC_01796]|uniref:TRAFAC clade GTPase domain-containing protein n=1 Tax=Micromonospora sp. NBC_01796 TaxID=2975987 RepID=UPI002DDACF01|nr:hypothetical protein [Micromonospora sp. NBC_01796]WSA87924.1 hypothetical protein OIE47_10135 [Micromonospora sp. NBC_01796]